MTTRYVRTRFNFAASLNSDYSRPYTLDGWEDAFSLEETPFIPIEASTSGTTVTLSDLASCSFLAIYNEDSTNYLEAEWYYERGTQDDTVTFAQAATGDTITDDSSGALYVTNGSRAGGYVRITDGATAGNNATWLIRSTTTNVITLVAESTLTADAGDAVTLQFQNRNLQEIQPGGWLFIGGAAGVLAPEQNLVLTANTAAVSCRVFYGGT